MKLEHDDMRRDARYHASKRRDDESSKHMSYKP